MSTEPRFFDLPDLAARLSKQVGVDAARIAEALTVVVAQRRAAELAAYEGEVAQEALAQLGADAAA